MGMIMHDDVPYGSGTSYTQGTGIAINNNVIAVDADNIPTEGSEKPAKSKGVYSALESNSAESTSLLKSTVGWTGKNLLPNDATSQNVNGITFTVNADGSVTVNGTSKEIAYLTLTEHLDTSSLAGCLVNGLPIENTSDIEYRIHSQSSYVSLKDFVKNNDVLTDVGNDVCFSIRIAGDKTVNNLTFYPMLRDASITDDTYEPYHESVEEVVEQIYAGNRVLGAKNLLPNNTTSQTINGVTFTVNDDGSITVNGTATTLTWRTVCSIKLPVGKYILNGCPAGGDTGQATYCIALWNTDGGTAGSIINVRDGGDGVAVDITQELTYSVNVGVAKGQTVNNLTFYPMLRLASDPDDTYVPYAMTNRELMDAVTPLASGILPQLMFSGRYGGTADKAINIDTIHKPFGYMMNINTGSYFSGTAPTDVGNSFMLVGFSSIVAGGVEFGAQLAFGWSANKIGFRKAGYSAQGTTWGAWKYLTIS